MIPAAFDYHAPQSVGEAIALLGSLGADAKILAGGHSLLPMMKLRFAQPAHLIDINRIPELRGVREEGAEIVIGAMTVENELITSALLQAKVPLLAEAPKNIADPQVRNRGTIGGDIAHGDPANDHPALALAVDRDADRRSALANSSGHVSSATVQASLDSQARRQAASLGDRRVGGQDRPTSREDGAGQFLIFDF